MTNFRSEAPKYWDAGYSVLAIKKGTKRPKRNGWPHYGDNLPKQKTKDEWVEQDGDCGIGLALGMEITPGYRIAAVDVDSDQLVPVTIAIIGQAPCAKIGKKGSTNFVLAPKEDKLKSTSFGKIDFLFGGRQTVIPPTIHPDTGKPYVWVGTPLLDMDPADFPVFGKRKLAILKLVVEAEETQVLLTGETTHDAGLRLSAKLVSFGLDDEEIRAIITALLPSDYEGNSLDELQGWIDSAREKGFDIGINKLPLDDQVAQEVEASYDSLIFTQRDGFLTYAEGVWNKVSKIEIKQRAKANLVVKISSKDMVNPRIRNVEGCLALNTYRENFGNYSEFICLNNGTLNVTTGELEEHSPDHELRYKLDIDYDPSATCPVYEDQLQHTFNGDQQVMDCFDEYIGLTLTPEQRFQKALYLVGIGGSGKSTVLGVAERLHAPEAISTIPLDKLEDERYRTEIADKLVCISFDVQTERRIFGETFIRITGGDPIATRRLFKEVDGRVKPSVRFMGSMNPDMPEFIASPDALRRRLIFLSCGGKVMTPDLDRSEKLKAELPGILARIVRALQRLQKRGRFDIPMSSTVVVEEYLRGYEPFDEFAYEHLAKDDTATVLVSDIANYYNQWADEHSEVRLSNHTIGRKLARLGFIQKYGTRTRSDGSKATARLFLCRVISKVDNHNYPPF